jgi:hypothetical protein
MNLKSMREYVANILDYNPNIEQYRNEVNDVLNQVYVTHFMERPWEYAQKEVDIVAYADRTQDFLTWTRGVRIATPADGKFNEMIAPFQIIEPQASGADLEKNKEYTIIARHDNAGSAYATMADPLKPLEFYPVIDAVPNNTTTETLSCTIKHRNIALPPDMIDILSIGLRGRQSGFRQPFFNIARYEDEKMGLDLDQVAIPTNFIQTDTLHIPSPRLKPTIYNAGVLANVTTTAGNYQAAYTFILRGATTDRSIVNFESAPIFGDEQYFDTGVSLNVTNLEVTDTLVGNLPTEVFRGLRKVVYIKTPDSNHFVRVSDTTLAEDQGNSSVILPNGIDFTAPFRFQTSPKLVEHSGEYQQIRLYPRQDQDYIMKLRYMFRPKELKDDQDAPMMPTDTHLFLCYGAIAELFNKHNNTQQAMIYEQKAKKELMKIENRFLTQKSKAHIKYGYRTSDSYYGRPFVRITRVP